MADGKSLETIPEKQWQIEQKWARQEFYRGSQYPPFSIEPFPYERQRLSGAGMTDEDRALRRQWLQDQELSPNEPRFVEELKPRNFFRRLYMNPLNYMFSKLIPVFGEVPAAMMRVTIPKMLLFIAGLNVIYYSIKYNPHDWTRTGGLSVFTNKPRVLNPDVKVEEKQPNDFYECGFKSRKVLRDGITSSV